MSPQELAARRREVMSEVSHTVPFANKNYLTINADTGKRDDLAHETYNYSYYTLRSKPSHRADTYYIQMLRRASRRPYNERNKIKN